MNRMLMMSPTNKRYLSLLWAALLLLGSVTPVKAQTLAEYQKEAAENNPALKAAWYEYLSSVEQLSQSGTLPDPEVGFAYFISPIETRLGPQQARISATQMFPWFGTLAGQRSVSEEVSWSKLERFREQRNRLFYEMELIWSDMMLMNEQIRISSENLQIINTLVQISIRKYETGQVPQVDVLRAQIEQEDIKTKIELLELDLNEKIRKFNELRNTPLETEIDLPDEMEQAELTPSREELFSGIQDGNPSLEQLRYQESAFEQRIRVASDKGKPSFGIGLDYIATGERTDVPALQDNGKDALIARVNVKIPLFRNRYNSSVRQAQLDLRSVQEQIISKQNSLENSLEDALKDMEDARLLYELYDEQQIQRVQQALNILTESYTADNTDFDEILRLYNRLYEYQLKKIQAGILKYKAVSYIRYLTGAQNISVEEINIK